jgi:Uma2 family endonuclease
LAKEHLDDLTPLVGPSTCQLVFGNIVVAPPPGRWHDLAIDRLQTLLSRQVDEGFAVEVGGSAALYVSRDTLLRPDAIVRSDRTDAASCSPGEDAPELVVEVLSRQSAHLDREVKHGIYERWGVTSYWIIDPLRPSLTVWELEEGRYVMRAQVEGDDVAELTMPFSVRVRPTGFGVD